MNEEDDLMASRNSCALYPNLYPFGRRPEVGISMNYDRPAIINNVLKRTIWNGPSAGEWTFPLKKKTAVSTTYSGLKK